MKGKVLFVVLMLLCLVLPICAEEAGAVAKVTTQKGSLNLRSTADSQGRILCEIPNGTCVLVLDQGESWCQVAYGQKTGYCMTCYLTLLREAEISMLDYRVLRKGDKGEDVLALKERLQELGYIRSGSELTSLYNDVAAERVMLFQREVGMNEDGVASQELQAYLFSEKAPVCTQKLPQIRARVSSVENGQNREICGCCFGEGCECCGYVGWIYY